MGWAGSYENLSSRQMAQELPTNFIVTVDRKGVFPHPYVPTQGQKKKGGTKRTKAMDTPMHMFTGLNKQGGKWDRDGYSGQRSEGHDISLEEREG